MDPQFQLIKISIKLCIGYGAMRLREITNGSDYSECAAAIFPVLKETLRFTTLRWQWLSVGMNLHEWIIIANAITDS